MCGRYNLRTSHVELMTLFDLETFPALAPRWNIAPTQQVAAVRQEGAPPVRRAAILRWGLVPHWSKDPKSGPPLINARGETIREKPSFRTAFRERRCLIPADGFYEWQRTGAAKQPFHICRRDGRPLAFAGLWEAWRRDGEALESCTIVTTTANETLQPLHERMPVIIAEADFETWLAGPPDAAAELVRPAPADLLTATAVGTVVNNARHDVPECLEPASS